MNKKIRPILRILKVSSTWSTFFTFFVSIDSLLALVVAAFVLPAPEQVSGQRLLYYNPFHLQRMPSEKSELS